jgi:uncharacterized protein YdaU (DUF1376 family)
MEEPTTPARPVKKNPRSGKLPWFPFYPADWLADARVAAMSLEEEGAYIRLICFCWREGSIPTDPASLARLLKVDEAQVANIWSAVGPCFQSDGTHRRLDAERRKQRTFSALQRARVMKRWDTGSRKPKETNNITVSSGINPVLPDGYSASASSEGRGAGSSSEMEIQKLAGNPDESGPAVRPEISRSFRKELTREERSLATQATTTIDWLRAHGFPDAGRWWGRANKTRDYRAMVETLEQLQRALQAGPVESPWGYAETTYAEKRANHGARAAEAESFARRDPSRRENPHV